MSNEGFFLDIAKISISIAGFAGVVGALRHTRDAPWKANEINGLKVILEFAIFGIVTGLLPTILGNSFQEESTSFIFLSTLLATVFFYEVAINVYRIKYSEEKLAPPRKFGLLLTTFLMPTACLFFVQIFNAFIWRHLVPIEIGALWLVIAGCIQFSISILHVKREEKH